MLLLICSPSRGNPPNLPAIFGVIWPRGTTSSLGWDQKILKLIPRVHKCRNESRLLAHTCSAARENAYLAETLIASLKIQIRWN